MYIGAIYDLKSIIHNLYDAYFDTSINVKKYKMCTGYEMIFSNHRSYEFLWCAFASQLLSVSDPNCVVFFKRRSSRRYRAWTRYAQILVKEGRRHRSLKPCWGRAVMVETRCGYQWNQNSTRCRLSIAIYAHAHPQGKTPNVVCSCMSPLLMFSLWLIFSTL